MSKLILIGPLSYSVNPTKTGGAIVQFETILQGLRNKQISFQLIDTNKLNYRSKKKAFIEVVKRYFKLVEKSDSVIYFSSTNYKYFLPLFLLKRLLVSHSLVLRKIGGDLQADLHSSWWQEVYLAFLLKRVDGILTEAKQTSTFLQKRGFRAKQFLNARSKPNINTFLPISSPFKLAYIGRLAQAKKVQNLVELDGLLEDTTIDVYGPVESVSPELFQKTEKVHYKGSFYNREIYRILSQYHAVILPSEFRGEGHPGILIEALMAGKPVIATNINFTSEVIQDGYNGILIKSGSTSEIATGIERLKQANYLELNENAIHSAKPYEVSKNIEILLKEINHEN